jgi:hypothetical protein
LKISPDVFVRLMLVISLGALLGLHKMLPKKKRLVRSPARLGCWFLSCIVISIVGLWCLSRTTSAQRSLKVSVEDASLRMEELGESDVGKNAKGRSHSGTNLQTIPDNTEPTPRPPLSSIVQGWNITGDVSWLLQFSVIGFPKCGTSTLMHHLRDHPEIHMFAHERCECSHNQHARLIKDLYNDFPPSTATQHFKRAIKCPIDLENTQLSLPNYRKFFPKTDFLVGVRHPVLW